jgi:hypothetical protein
MSASKAALEDLLRSRHLQREAPPLRGEDRRGEPIATGITTLDASLHGGLPRGRLSELHGPRSSGRTGFALSLIAQRSREGALAAWVDPADALDPNTASAAGCDLSRLLWVRGGNEDAVSDALAALSVLLGSGLFDIVVLDVGEVPRRSLQRLPANTWVRLDRLVRDTPTALLLLADAHVPFATRGVSLGFGAGRALWSGGAGPGRLFRGLESQVRAGGTTAPVDLSLHATH